jgi:hypothetical protein
LHLASSMLASSTASTMGLHSHLFDAFYLHTCGIERGVRLAVTGCLRNVQRGRTPRLPLL